MVTAKEHFHSDRQYLTIKKINIVLIYFPVD